MTQYRKHTSTLLLGLFLINITHAQQVSNPVDNIPLTPTPVTPPPLSYPGLDDMPLSMLYNYVRTQTPDIPVQSLPTYDIYCRQTTSFFDGLGRSLQTVAKKAHPEGNDIVQHKVYDATGKEVYQYLPFAKPTSTSSNGFFITNIKTRMQQFYEANGEEPYSKTEFDNSPLNRITKQLSPGKSWIGSNRGVGYTYRTNAAGEVRLWSISGTPSMPVSASTYSAGELTVTTVTDEDGKFGIEYKDKLGRLILKKSIASTSNPPVTDHNGYACTYYVYDDLNRLRFVLPPEAVRQVVVSGSTWSINSAILDGLCYTYTYDGRGNIVEKKIPGKGLEEFVYDKRDRLVMRRDGKLKAQNKWFIIFYDALNRPTVTSTILTGSSRQTMINYVEDAVSYPNTSFLYYIKNYNLINVYPASYSGSDMLSYTYYDDYSNLQSFNFDDGQFDNLSLPANGTVVMPVLSQATNGKATGSKVKVIDPDNPSSSTWLASVNYYDDYGRIIQTQSQNMKGGTDISSNVYYFQGMLYKNIIRHSNPSALAIPNTTDGPKTNLRIVKTFNRNLKVGGGSDQVNTITQKIEDGIEYQFANYFYDHLGRVVTKQTPAFNTLQEYNVRGFLNHIQVANPNNDPAAVHIFEENLYYDKGFTSKLYNGDIAGITWRKAGVSAPVEAYGYSYDKLDRLGHAEYRRQNASSWVNNAYDYTASNITYDLNGNIQSMNQRGVDLAISTTNPINIDQLSYNYAATSNQLIKVTDGVSQTGTPSLPDFKDKANLATEYLYDQNGNLTKDENKKISSITYSIDNKPEKITVLNEGVITYIYDGAGNLLQKKVHTNATNTDDIYDYIGNFVYKNNLLQYILNEEGRARPVASNSYTKFIYDYFVKDHLGNVRSTATAQPINGLYLASHEISMANIEQLIFDNIPNVRGGKPGSTDPNDGMAARLNADNPDTRIGTAIMLRTMPGDKFNISVDAFYEGEYEQEGEIPTSQVLESLMSALLGGNTYDGVPISELPDNVRTITQTLQNPALAGQLGNLIQTNNNPNAPKAHLNVLFFNDKMELIPGASGIQQVPAITTGGLVNWETMTVTPSGGTQVCCMAPGGGFVVIYVDNQSIGKDVWFDNLAIEHYTSEVLEENHYYPFGLTVNVTPSNNPSIPANKYLLTTKELEKSFNINTYDFGARAYPMSDSRWWQNDPLAEKYYSISPYAYCANNPVLYIDPNGKEIWITHKDQKLRYDGGKLYNLDGSDYTGKVKGFLKQTVNALNEIGNSKTGEEMLTSLSSSKNVFNISHVSKNPNKQDEFVASNTLKANAEAIKSNPAAKDGYEKRGIDLSGGSGGEVYWDPVGVPLNTTSGEQTNSSTDLAHELSHGYDANRGMLNNTPINGLRQEEWQAAYRENLIRGELGIPYRSSYGTIDENHNDLFIPILDKDSKPILPTGYKP